MRGAIVLGALLLAVAVVRGAKKDTAKPTVATTTVSIGAGSLYDRYCVACHGEKGDGAGPAAPWLWPKPRDLTRGVYKWRTTPSGKPPTDDDLAAAIRLGAPGTSMPGFAGILDDAQIAELVTVVKSFAPAKFATAAKAAAKTAAKAAKVVTIPAPPASADLAKGQKLWSSAGCASCHGADGKADSKVAAAAQVFDLTTEPMRRPRTQATRVADIWLSLSTGLDGTSMPSFASLPADDLWALAAYVDTLAPADQARPKNAGPIDPRAYEGQPKVVVGLVVAPQGPPPESLPPAAASLSSKQCGRCHAKQLREWQTARHSRTSSPGTLAQFPGASAKFVKSCLKCHAPLDEQMPGAAGFDEDLHLEGATCAGCHLRGWTRHGPPRRADSALLPIDSYPVVEEAIYERSDFCLPCHQLEPKGVAGRPLLDTYREWLEGPYMRRGVQCQHCHMPDREHTWRGVHDPATVKQAFAVRAAARAGSDGAIKVIVTVENVGAGHFAPTTPTPAAFLEVTLLDAKGKALGKPQTKRIGREIKYLGDKKGWQQIEDTRIPPGETLTFAPTFGKAPAATKVRVKLTMAPDDYYEGFYKRFLKKKSISAAQRKMFETALHEAENSKFIVWERVVDVAPSPKGR